MVYLSYQDDPTSSITVYYLAALQTKDPILQLRVKGDSLSNQSSSCRIERKDMSLVIFRYDIKELKAATEYEFHIEGNEQIFFFRTLAVDLEERNLRYIVGGDAYRSISSFRKMNATVGSLDPDFVVVAGDIAYTEGTPVPFKGSQWQIKRLYTFLQEYLLAVQGKDGRLVPILVTTGNHDIPKKKNGDKPLLFDLFPSGDANTSYRVVDIGEYLSFFLLDTAHISPIEEEQTLWLEKSLKERKSVPYKVPIYHISAYPSVYSLESKIPAKIRKYWVPLFEQYGVAMAFEHHNHAYKRTFPIKEGKIDPQGIVYIGDGCWGVPPRKPRDAWYLEKKMKKNCINLVELSKEKEKVSVYGINGDVIDVYERKAQGS